MSAVELEPGFIGDRYRLDRHIARGGMAEVWLGHDTFLDRQVAIKVLKRHIARDETSIERFRREALACAGLNHPNIVAVYDSFAHDGFPVVVMQYVQGRSLRDLLDKKRKLTPGLSIMMGAAIASALDATHQHGYIHRDIKPGNIFLDSRGQPKLADLGLARPTSGADMTMPGMVVGTPAYIAPEQARAVADLDIRADVYALGATLFHLVAGHPPYPGDDPMGVIVAVLNDPLPDLAAVAQGCPAEVAWLARSLMAKDRNERPANARRRSARRPTCSTARDDPRRSRRSRRQPRRRRRHR